MKTNTSHHIKLTTLALLLGLASLGAAAQDVNRMEQVVRAAVDAGQFSGTVLVARGDQVLLSKGYGLANAEWNLPNTPDTRFRLGSVTKQFTAAAVLLLEERGKLKLDDPIAKHLPDAPPAWKDVTVFHLLTHSAGIPNFTSLPDYPQVRPFSKTPEQLMALFRDKPLDFTPGEKFSYSNSGYIVLGRLIEQLSGQGYAAFLQASIFTPLGMAQTGYDTNAKLLPQRAAGYVRSGGALANAGYIDMSVPHAAGALYSTTADLLRWQQGLYGGKLLSADSLRKMTTAYKGDYAMGLIARDGKWGKQLQHGGGIEGFATQLSYEPQERWTVAVLSNFQDGAPGPLANRLTQLAHGETVVLASERKEAALPEPVLAARVGTYQFREGVLFQIKLEGGRLQSRLGNQRWLEVYAESEDRFFAKAVDADLLFRKDAQGKVTAVVLLQNGRETVMPRLPD